MRLLEMHEQDARANGEIGIIGGMYNIENGQVKFFDDTWLNGEVHNVFEQYIQKTKAVK